MGQEGQPQGRENEVWWFEVRVWSVAVISIAFLSACFIGSCVVNFHFIHGKTDKRLSELHTYNSGLNCFSEGTSMTEKYWSCCPQSWKSFSLNCYFISTDTNNWTESRKNCLGMKAHLLVINSKEEQVHLIDIGAKNSAWVLYTSLREGGGFHCREIWGLWQKAFNDIDYDFIIQNLNKSKKYYVGLSDPAGNGDWQWVDQTPYNASATFWHPGEPNNQWERCVVMMHKHSQKSWGWNDVTCEKPHRSICKMMKIHL